MTGFVQTLEPFDKTQGAGILNVIVETPKGQRNKFAYDPKFSCFKLKNVLPAGLVFPFGCGFVRRSFNSENEIL